MRFFLILIGLLGPIAILLGVLKRLRRSQLVKVTSDSTLNQRQNISQERRKSFNEAMSWKKQAVDYKAVHAAHNAAELQYAKGNLEEAEQGYIKAISLQPNHPEANNKLGLIYVKQGQMKKAEAIYRLLTESYPDKAIYFSNLGRVLYNQGNLEEAALAYEQSVNIDSRRAERFLSLGQVYTELGNNKKAISAFSRALDLNPRNEDLYFIITELLDQIKGYKEALAYLNAMLEIFPYNQKAKDLILEFRRKLQLSPLNSEQERQKSQGRNHQNSLFKNYSYLHPQGVEEEPTAIVNPQDGTDTKSTIANNSEQQSELPL